MKKRRKTKALTPNAKNPRKITTAKLAQLGHSMEELGDISGVCFNTRSGQLFGGHQRNENFDDTSKVVITKTYLKPSRTGTTAVGYILHKGERFSYREVDWPEDKETAAMIAANKAAGEWDKKALVDRMRSFDFDFDLSLTMFDEDERSIFATTTVKEHERSKADEEPVSHLTTVQGGLYQLGTHRLLCGAETEESDRIIEHWEEETGQKAFRVSVNASSQSKTILRKKTGTSLKSSESLDHA